MKKETLKIVGIILIVLQVLAVFGKVVGGNMSMFLITDLRSIFSLIGFFICGIIGVVLLVVSKKKK